MKYFRLALAAVACLSAGVSAKADAPVPGAPVSLHPDSYPKVTLQKSDTRAKPVLPHALPEAMTAKSGKTKTSKTRIADERPSVATPAVTPAPVPAAPAVVLDKTPSVPPKVTAPVAEAAAVTPPPVAEVVVAEPPKAAPAADVPTVTVINAPPPAPAPSVVALPAPVPVMADAAPQPAPAPVTTADSMSVSVPDVASVAPPAVVETALAVPAKPVPALLPTATPDVVAVPLPAPVEAAPLAPPQPVAVVLPPPPPVETRMAAVIRPAPPAVPMPVEAAVPEPPKAAAVLLPPVSAPGSIAAAKAVSLVLPSAPPKPPETAVVVSLSPAVAARPASDPEIKLDPARRLPLSEERRRTDALNDFASNGYIELRDFRRDGEIYRATARRGTTDIVVVLDPASHMVAEQKP